MSCPYCLAFAPSAPSKSTVTSAQREQSRTLVKDWQNVHKTWYDADGETSHVQNWQIETKSRSRAHGFWFLSCWGILGVRGGQSLAGFLSQSLCAFRSRISELASKSQWASGPKVFLRSCQWVNSHERPGGCCCFFSEVQTLEKQHMLVVTIDCVIDWWWDSCHRRGSVHRRTGSEFGINSPCSTWPSFQEFLHNTMDPRDLNRSQAFDFRTFTCRWRVVTHLCEFQHGLSLFFWFTSYVHRCLLVLRPYESSDFQRKRQHPSFLMGILHLWPILESFCFPSMVCVESFTLQEVRSQIHGKDFLPRT